MRKIHLTLILIAALWNVLPAENPFRSLLDQVLDDPGSGIIAAGDPEVDPVMINTPPPRQ